MRYSVVVFSLLSVGAIAAPLAAPVPDANIAVQMVKKDAKEDSLFWYRNAAGEKVKKAAKDSLFWYKRSDEKVKKDAEEDSLFWYRNAAGEKVKKDAKEDADALFWYKS